MESALSVTLKQRFCARGKCFQPFGTGTKCPCNSDVCLLESQVKWLKKGRDWLGFCVTEVSIKRESTLLYRHECFTGKYTTRKIHKNYIWDPSGLFSIISREFIDDVISVISLYYFIDVFLSIIIIKRTLHGGAKIWILFSCCKDNILLTRCARS